eukprot:4138795-Amphidinium_carterae.1
MRGKIMCAESLVFGRMAWFPRAQLSRHMAKSSDTLGRDSMLAIRFIIEILANAKPRRLVLGPPSQRGLLFTDGSLEGEVAGMGGLLITHQGGGIVAKHFSATVPQELLQMWSRESGHPIGHVELLVEDPSGT